MDKISTKIEYNKSLQEQLSKVQTRLNEEEKTIQKYKTYLSSYGYVYDEIKNNKYKIADVCVEAYYILCDIEKSIGKVDKYKEKINEIKNKMSKHSRSANKLSSEKKLAETMPSFFTDYENKLAIFIGSAERAHKSVNDLYIKIVNKTGKVLSTSEVAFNGCEMFGIIRGEVKDVRISSVLIGGDKKMLKHYRYILEEIDK